VSIEDLAAGPRSVERTITLTDAVVAIAMTLLVLPLVELAPEVDPQDVGGLLREHTDLFLSFVISFLVIYVFWLAHERAFAVVEQATPALRSLNMWWLLLVAFLPFPTALVGRHVSTASAPVYIGTMLVLSALTSAMIEVAHRSARRAGRAVARPGWRVALTWATPAVFAVCTLVSAVSADAGLFGLLLLLVVRLAEGVVPAVLTGRRG
jgi:uncharacterized membrane protein